MTAPDFGGGERVLVRIEYQNITLNYNFSSSLTVNGPASGSTLTVVRRIYYPQTGRGYLMLDHSTYGMARRISARKDMTGSSGSITDGVEIAYTKYFYTTIDSSDPYGQNQSGSLNDSPQYSKQQEWWLGKTDANGNADSTPTEMTFQRQNTTDANGNDIEIDKTFYPNGLEVWTTTGSDADDPLNQGRVVTVEQRQGSTVWRKATHTYVTGIDGGTQLSSIETKERDQPRIRTEFAYESYGRLKNVYEFGFAATFQRRTRYLYSDTTAHIDARLLHLVTEISVFDSGGSRKDRAVFTYDDYVPKGGLEYYGLTSSTYPPNHDSTFDQNNTTRGNVTAVRVWSSISGDVSTTTYTKFDIFGNVVEADVSCCVVKAFGFSSTHHYSQPDWARDGSSTGPNLTTSFLYTFNTGLVTRVTDPDGLNTNFSYDSAWRLLTVTASTGAVTTTQFDKDSNQNDQLAYKEQVSYTDNGVSKTITSKSWFNGAGQVLRAGTGVGSSPSSFDTSAVVYDGFGRVSKQSNPYAGDSSGLGSPSHWTVNTYDLLSRVTVVTLPDSQTVQTSYATNAATVTVTDQVGRKRRSEVDGLGRLIKVTEQDPATGSLVLDTTYAYDLLDNLITVNQGGQTRSFVYDAKSRLTSHTTPEEGTVNFTYASFDAVATRSDPRSVVTTYGYDALNRLQSVSYNTSSSTHAAATASVSISYRTSSPGKGQVNSIGDGLGSESYGYDSMGRVSSKTRTIDSFSYTTQYQYNTANQLTLMIYPSGKRVKVNRDTRGRLSGLDKVDSSGNLISRYINSVGYNVASHVTSIALANGVTENLDYSTDGRLQLARQRAMRGTTTLMDLNYSYGAASGESGAGTSAGNSGQLMKITSSPASTINGQARHQNFTYDNVGRLVTATGWGNWQRRFGYDRWANRTGVWNAVSGGTQLQAVTIATTNSVANNRIATVNGVTYTYDAGNLINDGSYGYVYDAENRLVSVSGLATASYGYDAANRRLKKVAAGVTTHYVWEGAQVIAEYSTPTEELPIPPVARMGRAGLSGLRFLSAGRAVNVLRFNISTVFNDPNKLRHIFQAKHNLQRLGSPVQTIDKVTKAVFEADAKGKVPASGAFKLVSSIDGHQVVVTGRIVRGELRYGSIWIP